MPLPTMNIPDFSGLTHTVNLANSGRQAAADSSAVVLSNEDLAALAALPTGASTAANQTALNALFPTSPGQKTMANSLAVAFASDQSSLSTTPIAPISSSRLLSAAGTTNATSVKASGGTLKAIQGYNAKTSPVFLKLYNKASAPTVGTDTPVKTIYLPASSAFALDFGFTFSTGIAYAITGAVADADTTALVAGDILCLNVDYI